MQDIETAAPPKVFEANPGCMLTNFYAVNFLSPLGDVV